MSKTIRVAIGGYGRSGCDIHGRYLATDPRFEVVAAADELPERRQEAEEKFGCKTYPGYREMLAAGGFELFVNATPSRFHVEASLAALEAGFQVLSEKPSASNVADFDRITRMAEVKGRMFFPFQNSRFYPFFRKLREVLASGVLGEIVSIRINWSGFARRWDWQTLRSELGGNLLNTGPHLVDHAVVLFGDAYPGVFCRMASHHYGFGGDAESYCALTLHGPGRPVIEVQISSHQAYPQDQYIVQGTFGGLTGGVKGLKWKYFDPAAAPKQEFWKPWSRERRFCSEALDWQEESWSFADTSGNDNGFIILSGGVYNNLYAVLREGGERIIQLEEVRRQIFVMEEAHKQNWQEGK